MREIDDATLDEPSMASTPTGSRSPAKATHSPGACAQGAIDGVDCAAVVDSRIFARYGGNVSLSAVTATSRTVARRREGRTSPDRDPRPESEPAVDRGRARQAASCLRAAEGAGRAAPPADLPGEGRARRRHAARDRVRGDEAEARRDRPASRRDRGAVGASAGQRSAGERPSTAPKSFRTPRSVRDEDLPEERIEIPDPALEGKAKRIGFEESCRRSYRRGGAIRLVVARGSTRMRS